MTRGIVIGAGIGGLTTAAVLATCQPGRFLCSTPPQMRHLDPLNARQIQSRGPELSEMAWHDPRVLTTETLAIYQKPLHVDNWDKALSEFTASTRPLDLSGRLSEITQPVLVVTGDDDRIVSPPTAVSGWQASCPMPAWRSSHTPTTCRTRKAPPPS